MVVINCCFCQQNILDSLFVTLTNFRFLNPSKRQFQRLSPSNILECQKILLKHNCNKSVTRKQQQAVFSLQQCQDAFKEQYCNSQTCSVINNLMVAITILTNQALGITSLTIPNKKCSSFFSFSSESINTSFLNNSFNC